METPSDTGEHAAFSLFVPVSSVAALLGENRHRSVDDAVHDIVAKNSDTFVWSDASEDVSEPNALHASICDSDANTLQRVIEATHADHNEVALLGLIQHCRDVRSQAARYATAIPGSMRPTFDATGYVGVLTNTVLLDRARSVRLSTNDAARKSRGIEGVRDTLVQAIVDVRAEMMKVDRAIGARAQAGDTDAATRIAVAASSESTRHLAISHVARVCGATLDSVTRLGARCNLENIMDKHAAVPPYLPAPVSKHAASHVACSVGTSCENDDVERIAKRKDTPIRHRNVQTRYARIYASPNVAIDIAGRVDGIAKDDVGDYLVESKHRTKRMLGVPAYERIQVELYMRMWGMVRCLHVETCRDEQSDTWIEPDDDLLASIETRLREVVSERILNACVPAVGARMIANACVRKRVEPSDGALACEANRAFGMDAEGGCCTIDGVWVQAKGLSKMVRC
jgi:hypothetical protein